MLVSLNNVVQFPTRVEEPEVIDQKTIALEGASAKRLNNAKQVAKAIQNIMIVLNKQDISAAERKKFMALNDVFRAVLTILVKGRATRTMMQDLTLAEIRLKKIGGENPFKLV